MRGERAELAEQAEKWATFVLANMLWAIVSIPLVTLPAATAGLFAVMSARARGRQPDLLATFFCAMRRLWLKATLLAGINLLAGGLIALNLAILPRMDMTGDPFAFMARSVTLFMVVALLMVNLYAWPLLALLETMPLGRLLKSALQLAFAHPFWSMGVLVAAALPVLLSLLLPRGAFVIFTASAVAWIVCRGTWRVIRRHLPEAD